MPDSRRSFNDAPVASAGRGSVWGERLDEVGSAPVARATGLTDAPSGAGSSSLDSGVSDRLIADEPPIGRVLS